MTTSVRKSVGADVFVLASRLRSADLQEIRALRGSTPIETVLQDGYRFSEPCLTGTLDNKPVVMFGVAPIFDRDQVLKIGSIWLLGTDAISEQIPTSFLRWSKKMLPVLTQPYDVVFNIVDKRNEVHVKWIKWLGFSFIREIPIGVNGEPFYEFARIS